MKSIYGKTITVSSRAAHTVRGGAIHLAITNSSDDGEDAMLTPKTARKLAMKLIVAADEAERKAVCR